MACPRACRGAAIAASTTRTPGAGPTGAARCSACSPTSRSASGTGGRLGLVDAFRGLLAAGGNDQVDWPIERAFAAGDKAIGVPVLEELYRKMKDAPVAPDLDALWHDLGLVVRNHSLELDDKAPKAAIRRAITARPGSQLQ